jgi:mannan endo-1,4-beta-mannosidase
MTSTPRSTPLPRHATIAAGVLAGLLVVAGAASNSTNLASAQPTARLHDAATSVKAPTKQQLLYPSHKYYGISVPGAPQSLAGVNNVTAKTGKQPNLLLFFEAWNSGAAAGTPNIDTASIKAACQQGLLPMLTWESWDTSVEGTTNPGVAYDQPAFAPSKIAAGDYDKYLRRSALAIKSLGHHCPVALRFDQEQNGYWYPWGLSTQDMPGTPASRAEDYVKMWRHVWTIFKNQGATNVLWTWCPNYQGLVHKGLPALSASYPGNKYVDWVGIDAYYNKVPQSFSKLFGSTMQQLSSVAPMKPWLVAETGVGSYPQKAAQISNLLKDVARNRSLNGFVYFERAGSRNFWPFVDPNEPGALPAFKAGVANPRYASGQPGSL